MRIVMATNAIWPDRNGGHERVVRDLAREMVGRGHTVVVIARRVNPGDPPEQVEDDGVRVLRYDVPSKEGRLFALERLVGSVLGVKRFARGEETAVLHSHFPLPAFAFRGQRPYVHSFYAPMYKEILPERQGSYWLPRGLEPLATRGMRAFEGLAIGRAARVVLLSEFTRDELAKVDVRAAAGAVVVPGGVDLSRFQPGTSKAVDEWAAAADPLIVCVRRFTPRTGVLELVEAMPGVLAEFPRARLAVIGSGGLESQIRSSAGRIGADAVRVVGRVDDSELVDWYRVADLAVTPTQELEGFGLATAEALGCGTPVLVTPVGANPEVVKGLPGPWIAPGRSSSDLAVGIVRALRARRDGLGDECREHSVRFGWDAVCQQYETIYAGVAAAVAAR